MQEACELRMPFRKRAPRRERADPDRGLRLLRDLHHQIDGAGAVDTGADDEGRALARRERGNQRLYRFQIGAELRLTLRASIGCAGRVQSSIGIETKVGPHGGCIAT